MFTESKCSAVTNECYRGDVIFTAAAMDQKLMKVAVRMTSLTSSHPDSLVTFRNPGATSLKCVGATYVKMSTTPSLLLD